MFPETKFHIKYIVIIKDTLTNTKEIVCISIVIVASSWYYTNLYFTG